MEKYCLKWNEFEGNIRESFRKLREEQRFFDVTLATDDGQHIQAHKMILSAGSDFFSDIFMKSDHTNMLIYLKGISSAELEHVTDFLYNGETFITQEELKQFLETAQELQVKGLQGDLQGIGQDVPDTQKSSDQDTNYREKETENNQDIVGQESVLDSLKELADAFGTVCDTVLDGNTLALNTNKELDLQIEQMTEKNEGLRKCKVCGKTAARKGGIRRHAETHIEGVSHACHICKKIFSTRNNLQYHISAIHSELVSCDLCGKSGMNKQAYRHKFKYHKTLSVNQ